MTKKSKAERPPHLRVMGTHLSSSESKTELMTLLSTVPLEWNFETEEGENFLRHMHSRIESGTPVEVIADEAGLGEDLVAIYTEWVKGHG